jgi:hypothetical protein
MYKVGSVYRMIEPYNGMVQVLRTWDKPIIDPECHLSVEIAGFISFVYISGDNIGLTKSMKRQSFSLCTDLCMAEFTNHQEQK